MVTLGLQFQRESNFVFIGDQVIEEVIQELKYYTRNSDNPIKLDVAI